MKKKFLKWIFALCIATIAGANMFAEFYYEVKEAGILWNINVYDSATVVRGLNTGVWPEDFEGGQNEYANGFTENSFPSGKVCIVLDYDSSDKNTITIPEKIGGYPVVGIGHLYLEDNIKTVILPKNVLFLSYIQGDNLETIKIQSSELAFLYDKYEKCFSFEEMKNPSLSEKSKADLRKAGYKGDFN